MGHMGHQTVLNQHVSLVQCWCRVPLFHAAHRHRSRCCWGCTHEESIKEAEQLVAFLEAEKHVTLLTYSPTLQDLSNSINQCWFSICLTFESRLRVDVATGPRNSSLVVFFSAETLLRVQSGYSLQCLQRCYSWDVNVNGSSWEVDLQLPRAIKARDQQKLKVRGWHRDLFSWPCCIKMIMMVMRTS